MLLPALGISSLFKQTSSLITNTIPVCLNQVRTRITCSRVNGKQKSVKTAMERFFRLEKRVWIHAAPGVGHKLWKKPVEKRFLLQQLYIADRGMSRNVERMAGNYYKKIDLRTIVDKPFSLYHTFLKKEEKKFFP